MKLTLTKARMIAATPTLLRVAGLFDLEADLLNAGNGSRADIAAAVGYPCRMCSLLILTNRPAAYVTGAVARADAAP